MPHLATFLALPASHVASAVGAGTSTTDLGALFAHAHIIVKVVMIMLAVMFAIGVYIIIYKAMCVGRAGRRTSPCR